MKFTDDNIRVNAVSTGVVDTLVYHKLFGGKAVVAETLMDLNGIHPIGRNGTPIDIANSILFLCSDKASGVTGANWDTDGGVMAGRNEKIIQRRIQAATIAV